MVLIGHWTHTKLFELYPPKSPRSFYILKIVLNHYLNILQKIYKYSIVSLFFVLVFEFLFSIVLPRLIVSCFFFPSLLIPSISLLAPQKRFFYHIINHVFRHNHSGKRGFRARK